jgi:hypothetical protein
MPAMIACRAQDQRVPLDRDRDVLPSHVANPGGPSVRHRSNPPASFTITTTHPWSGNSIETCKPSDPTFTCTRTFGLDEVNWVIRPTL